MEEDKLLPDNSVDMVFMCLYDNIKYSNHPNYLGKISTEKKKFYQELGNVAKEIHRIFYLRGIKYLFIMIR